MSEENVDLVRRTYARWDFQDRTTWSERIDRAFREDLDEEFELRLEPDYPEGEPVFRGRAGIEQFIAMLDEAWSEWRVEPERFLDAGERVVGFARIVGKGGASGVQVEVDVAHLWTIRGGRVTSMHSYGDQAEALEAAGLRE